jgi:hypothetical protein
LSSGQLQLHGQWLQVALQHFMEGVGSGPDSGLLGQLVSQALGQAGRVPAGAPDAQAAAAGQLQMGETQTKLKQDVADGSAKIGLLSWLEGLRCSRCSSCGSDYCHSALLCAAAVLQLSLTSHVGYGATLGSWLQEHLHACSCCLHLVVSAGARDHTERNRTGQGLGAASQQLKLAALQVDCATTAMCQSLRCCVCQAAAATVYAGTFRAQLASCQAVRQAFAAATVLATKLCHH